MNMLASRRGLASDPSLSGAQTSLPMWAACSTTTHPYNDRGQVLTKTNAKGETTTYTYSEDEKGYLQSIESPLPGSATSFTYDSFGRVQTKTDESGYTLTFEYDNLDRLRKITY